MTKDSELKFVCELARSAGAIVREQHGHVARMTKTHVAADHEAVTVADRESQRHIIQGLRARFASDGMIGEENDNGTAITFECSDPDGRNWVIDPIDGTNNFVAGLGTFAVCIGLMDEGMPVLGVVYDVMRDEMYAAARGEGAWLNDRPIHARKDSINDSSVLMMTSNLIRSDKQAPRWAQRWINQTQWKLRLLGSAAIEAVAVASGVAYGAVTVNGKLWDTAAASAIVLEAGGIVTDLEGRPRYPYSLHGYKGAKVPFLAAAPLAHPILLADILKYS